MPRHVVSHRSVRAPLLRDLEGCLERDIRPPRFALEFVDAVGVAPLLACCRAARRFLMQKGADFALLPVAVPRQDVLLR